MTAPESVFVALGSNLGDRARYLAFGRDELASLPTTVLVAESQVKETVPIGPRGQPRYLNQMVLLHTHLTPRQLLGRCQEIERRAGRVRTERWGSRTLDLDIVRFGDRVVDDPDLRIPHDGLQHRRFWQDELAELAPYTNQPAVPRPREASAES